MIKSSIRKKIIKKRQDNYVNNLSIDPEKVLKLIDNSNMKIKIVGGYYPYNYEIDTLNIFKILSKRKYKLSIPKISNQNQMNFFEWSFEEPLNINTYGIPEPSSKKIVYPDLLLVPLVAFDKKLNRIGYGGGYYDRYIAKILKKKDIITIGLGYSFQLIKKVLVNKFDIKLNYIITEKNIYK